MIESGIILLFACYDKNNIIIFRVSRLCFSQYFFVFDTRFADYLLNTISLYMRIVNDTLLRIFINN